MPAPWAAGAEARIIGNIHGSQTVNVLHFATNDVIADEGSLDTILLALAEALKDCVVEFLLPAVSSEWTFERTDAKRIFPAPSDPIIATGVPTNIGELSPTSVSFTASLLNIRTGGGGKRGRGRMFLPPAGEGEMFKSTLDGDTLVLIAAFAACVAAKFMGAAPETPWHFGVLSPTTLKAVGGTFDNSFRVATSLNPKGDVSLLSSRRKGRGI